MTPDEAFELLEDNMSLMKVTSRGGLTYEQIVEYFVDNVETVALAAGWTVETEEGKRVTRNTAFTEGPTRRRTVIREPWPKEKRDGQQGTPAR